jgi:hypothetical protein
LLDIDRVLAGVQKERIEWGYFGIEGFH